ncbi:MAG: biotin/lipoyl-containing protein [Alphaproteobacteria bacterium]|nr:biotin/lipoyl-containing protein [Alphaproteobacteria bacterium]
MESPETGGDAMNLTLYIDGTEVPLSDMVRHGEVLSFTLQGTAYRFRSARLPDGSMLLEREIRDGIWQRTAGSAWQNKDVRRVQLGGLEASVTELTRVRGEIAQAELSPRAPMPGVIRQILVAAGDTVRKGQPLVVMEAMKLQTTLSAGADATVAAVLVTVGAVVQEGAELVTLTAHTASAA